MTAAGNGARGMPRLPPRSLDGLRQVVEAARQPGSEIRVGPRSLAILEHMLEQPEQVTLGTIAGIARDRGVSPSTLTRLARRLGFEGFKAFQRLFRLDIAHSRHFYSEQARRLIDGRAATAAPDEVRSPGLEAASREVENLAETVANLVGTEIQETRDAMLSANRLYILGLRGCHGVAHYLGYYLGFLGRPTVTLGNSGFTLAEDISDIGAHDVLVAVTLRPETRLTIDCCRLASSQGATVVTMTNDYASPARPYGDVNLYARCEGPYYFNPMAALFVLAEVLLAELAAALGEEMMETMKRREEVFGVLGIE